MPLKLRTVIRTLLSSILAVSPAVSCTFARAQQDQASIQIIGPIDETNLAVLKGNTHPLAAPELDLGTAPATLPMGRMVLVLKRSAARESSLKKLLDEMHVKGSPKYHKWLTPEDFGRQFGPSDADIQTVATWLRSHGFQVSAPSKGRNVIEFSGTASQVLEAFHTAIHKYVVNGEQHWANASDPKIPTVLTSVVTGINSLHDFPKKPLHRALGMVS